VLNIAQAPDPLGLTIFVVVMLIFPLGLVIAGKIFGPSNPSPTKNMTFECGQIPEGSAHLRFTIRYYPYAMIYAIFGAIAVFLLLTAPALTALIQFGGDASFVVLGFLVIITLTLVSAVMALRSARWRVWE